jgi:hypothetical protein
MPEKFRCHDTGQSLGPYSLEEMRMYQFDGLLSSEALAAPESAPEQWVRVSDLLAAPPAAEEFQTDPVATEAPVAESLTNLPEPILPQPELKTSSPEPMLPLAPESTDWMVTRVTATKPPRARPKDSWNTNPWIILPLYAAFTAICILIIFISSKSPESNRSETDAPKLSPQDQATRSAHARLLPLIQEWEKTDSANRACLSKRLACITQFDDAIKTTSFDFQRTTHAGNAQDTLISLQNSSRKAGVDSRLLAIINSMVKKFGELERNYNSATIDALAQLVLDFNRNYMAIQKSNTDKLINSISPIQIYKCNSEFRAATASLLKHLEAHKIAQAEKMIEDEGKYLDAIASDIRNLNSAAP